jgi:hypothetical protein
VTVLARVQGHPSRKRLHAPLLDALAPLERELSIHSSQPPNPLNGYQQALDAIPDVFSHVVVLQDDVALCKNFPLAVTRIAESQPDVPVILFLARLPKYEAQHFMRALIKDQRYVQARPRSGGFLPVVGVLWPRQKAEFFRDWTREYVHRLPGYPRRAPASDDAAFALWSIRNKERVLVAVPNLVEHPDAEPSIIGRRPKWGKDKGRVALSFIGEGDPLTLDW